MSNKTEILSFDELARFHGLSLMKWDEDNYASENTKLAKDFFEAGQQFRQDEIDSIVNLINKYQYSSGDRILREVMELLKWVN